ncbi:MAG: Smr/MutS family protein [Pseudomonadota bacterium]
MGKKDSDTDLFRQMVGDVKPVTSDKTSSSAPPPRPVPRQRELDNIQVMDELLGSDNEFDGVDTGEELLYSMPGVQHSVMKKLRQGKFSIQAEIDLHGMTVDNAHAAISEFLKYCRDQRLSCVRIIHGKGYGSDSKLPVLKNKVNQWLRRYEQVMAFSSARPADGGTGAVYVLLRKKKHER